MPRLAVRAHRGRSALPIAVLAAVLLALPPAADAGSLTKRDRGGVSNKVAKRFHLTRAERRALDITSVQVSGKNDLGVVVDVRFKGDVERLIGRGHLRRAAIALELVPRSRRAKSAVIVTQGAGTNQRIRRRTRSDAAGAMRSGRSVRFFIRGGGFGRIKAAKVRALPRAPRAARRAIAAQANDGVEELTDAEVEEITLEEIAADALAATWVARQIDPNDLDCDELHELGDDLEDALDRAGAYFDAIEAAEAELQQALQEAEGGERAAIQRDLLQLRATRTLVVASIVVLRSLLDEVDDIIEEECGPPPSLQAVMTWQFFGPGEVVAKDAYFHRKGGGAESITGITIVIPPDGSNRQITNFVCPSQFARGEIFTRNAPNDSLYCYGGSLALNERFQVNVRTEPAPTPGMGGQLYPELEDATSSAGPFTITGP